MNPEELTVNQQIISIAAGLFILALMVGSFSVNAWVLIAWRRVMGWSGWLRDQVHDRIGLIDLIGCFVFIAIAQVALAGLYYREIKRNLPEKPAAVESASVAPAPAWLVFGQAVQDQTGQDQAVRDTTASELSLNTPDVQETALSQDQKQPEANSEAKGVSESPWFMFAATFSLVLGSLVSAYWTLNRTKSSATILGMTSGRVFSDLMVGVLVFLWITPLVLSVNILVSQLTEIQYEHPVIDSLKGRSWAFPVLFTSAVLFAPLWEEYAFRFLLVNWLDTIRHHGLNLKAVFLGGGGVASGDSHLQLDSPVELMVDEQSGRQVTQSSEFSDAMRSDANGVGDSNAQALSGIANASANYPPWWIACVSGLVFGLAHFEYGVSWVPLVVLGTVLARVYQLQRSILPCFVIHALFNSLAMLGFAVELFVKSPN